METERVMRGDAATRFSLLYEVIKCLANGMNLLKNSCQKRQNQRECVSTSDPQECYRKKIFMHFLDHVIAESTGQLTECCPDSH